MKHTIIQSGNKLTKLTNSFHQDRGAARTRKQTHKTHKLIKYFDRNKLTKLTQKMKLTFFSGFLQRQIAEISNIIRYLFFSSEFVSLQYLATCEEKIGRVNILYRGGLQQTHQTHKLTLPMGGV